MDRLFTFLFLLLLSVQIQAQPAARYNLSGHWQFSQSGMNEWLPAIVPGTVHTDLMANGKIKDPFIGMEEQAVQWIDKVDWSYQTVFNADPAWLANSHTMLVFEGLDTYATVWLNGIKIIDADNMFLTWKADIKRLLQEKNNELVVTFRSPIQEGLKKQSEYGIRMPANNDQSVTGQIGDNVVSVFTRKAGYHFGWDWGPRLVPSGIWRPVYIESWNDFQFSDVFITTTELTGKSANLLADISVTADRPVHGRLVIQSGDQTWLTMPVDLEKGTNSFKQKFTVQKPRLWWPSGYGEQFLYPVTCSISDGSTSLAVYSLKTGIRTINLIQDIDADMNGQSFYFNVNGVPVFAKGANYIPNDVFLPRVTDDVYRTIIGSATFANMNMLRVWGGGIYENDLFYDLCDQAGILIWQDFMFACSMYPGNDGFLASVKEEARQNIVRLRNHPCIALWCGNNEIETAWGQYRENMGWGWKQRYNPAQRNILWAAYDTIFQGILPAEVKRLDPTISYWASSPSAGLGRLSTDETRSGDNHYWGVWHRQHPFSEYNHYISRFMSEYGFQSFPELDAVKKYTQPADWNIESPVMSSHQRSGIGNLRIREYMAADYIVPKDFGDFLYVSHILQAEGIKTAIEAHRKNKPYCMGTLYWQLNDCWPVASWSSTDYYRNFKALHYYAKKAFEPVVVIASAKNDSVEFRVVSDRNAKIKSTLQIRVCTLDGKPVSVHKFNASIEPSGNKMIAMLPVNTLLQGHRADEIVMVATLVENDVQLNRNLFYLAKPKALQLHKAHINLATSDGGSDWIIQISADQLVKNLMVTFNGRAGIFSDNYFDVLPGETTTIRLSKTWSPDRPDGKLATRSLADTY